MVEFKMGRGRRHWHTANTDGETIFSPSTTRFYHVFHGKRDLDEVNVRFSRQMLWDADFHRRSRGISFPADVLTLVAASVCTHTQKPFWWLIGRLTATPSPNPCSDTLWKHACSVRVVRAIRWGCFLLLFCPSVHPSFHFPMWWVNAFRLHCILADVIWTHS